MKAADVMTKDVVFAEPDLPVKDIAGRMLTHNVSALPVLDRGGLLVGIVSEGDLMRRGELGTEKKRSWWLQLFVGDDYLAHEFVKFHGHTARDVMTRKVVTVDRNTPVEEIVSMLETHQIKRVPVMHEGRMVGIVSRANLLHALVSSAVQARPTISEQDRAIQSSILTELGRQPWWHQRNCGITVSDGMVHLWGTTESPEQREALRVVAEGVGGVRGVKNHVNVVRPMVLYTG